MRSSMPLHASSRKTTRCRPTSSRACGCVACVMSPPRILRPLRASVVVGSAGCGAPAALCSPGVAGQDDITRDIEEGPAGPEIGAFFDLDRTLIAGFSVFPLVVDGLMSGRIGAGGLAATSLAGLRFQLGQLGFSGFVSEAAGIL